MSLNDTLLVGPTVHSPLIDVLLRFRFHCIALTTDVSRMYRAVELTSSDRDLHRFVWRRNPDEPLQDYRMTRVTFGVSASSFAPNMSVKQNALDFALQYPQAAIAVEKSFYVDDGLTGANSIEEAVELQMELQELFSQGNFLLRKWNSNRPAVLQHIPSELRDVHSTQTTLRLSALSGTPIQITFVSQSQIFPPSIVSPNVFSCPMWQGNLTY